MPSSTSSFDRNRLLLAGGTTIIAVLLALFAASREEHLTVFTGSQLKDNRARLQAWVARERAPRIAVGGSSFAGRMEPFMDLSQTSPLAQGGWGSRTAASLLRRSHQLPKVFLVEISTAVVYAPDEASIAESLHPAWRKARNIFPFLQDHRQPISLLLAWFSRHKAPSDLSSPGVRSSPMASIADPDAKTAHEILGGLAALEGDLVSLTNSCRVVFFSLPAGDGPVEQRRLWVVQEAKRVFPPSIWAWAELPPDRAWQTTDGIHLNPGSARFAWRHLVESCGRFADAPASVQAP